MAFDQPTRNRLARFVSDARTLLADEFTRQLQNDYGLDPTSGDVAETSKLGHLDDSKQETARLLRVTLQHYLASADSSTADKAKKARQEVLNRIVREQAFTVLNRLCALRMAEARELLIESVANGYESKGFQLYTHPAGTALGETGDAYRCFLFSVFDEFAVDLPVLFDRFSPQGRLFPRESVLLSLLKLINHADLEPLWPEDETIGWVYQYFNTDEDRRRARYTDDGKPKPPQNSRDLAVRNQFFTPRYVVEFLTDNTLGRIWYEMTQGQTSLKDSCRYLVRRPDEVFLGQSTNPDEESPLGDIIRMAELLQEGTAEEWPEFDDSDDSIQAMIHLAHCVNGYARHPHGDQWDWFAEITETLRAGRLADLGTQELLDGLFMICRADRAGGEGAVYSEDWFIAACNEVRTRALRSREPNLCPEELLRQPVFVPYRPLKDPRDIRMLDPACGSMHFGLYAFDLFERIYDEYFNGRLNLVVGESELDDVVRVQPVDFPRLIIEQNIYGIDIDPRAVQIAGLSLWLRAQRSWREQGVRAQVRPRIEHSNVVCAEPMPGEEEILEEFLKSLQKDRLETLIRRVLSVPEDRQIRATQRMAEALCDLVRTAWKEMELAGEAGSLLRIEDALRNAIETGKAEWEEKLPLFRLTEFGLGDETPKTKYIRSIPGEGEDFWNRAEAIVLAALRDYAEQTENGGSFQRRLFANDAARGFAFVDVCRKDYDVALMNPPFGEPAVASRAYISRKYPESKEDIYTTFVDRFSRKVGKGALGVISNRTGFFLAGTKRWREHALLAQPRLTVLADLGDGVLDDALVEAAAYVISTSNAPCVAFRLLDQDDKAPPLLDRSQCVVSGSVGDGTFVNHVSAFRAFPESRIAYWASPSIRGIYQSFSGASGSGLDVKFGLSTKDDPRFLRLCWEVPFQGIVTSQKAACYERPWMYIAKGGEYALHYGDIHIVANWANYGHEIGARVIQRYPYLKGDANWVLHSEVPYGRPGVTYTKRTTSGFSPRFLPAGCLISDLGCTIYADDDVKLPLVLATYASRAFGYLLEFNLASGDSVHSGSAARHYEIGTVAAIPVPSVTSLDEQVSAATESIWIRKATIDSREETSRYFTRPWKFDAASRELRQLAKLARDEALVSFSEILSDASDAETKVQKLYCFDDAAKSACEAEFGPDVTSYSREINSNCRTAIALLWAKPIGEVIKQTSRALGFSRFISKMTYAADRRLELVCHRLKVHPNAVTDIIRELPPSDDELSYFAQSIVSYCIGCVFGRWDIRFATDERSCPELPSPLDSLPVCPAGMLQNAEGLPAQSQEVPDDYPLRISWSGILVDEAGHREDIVRRISDTLKLIWEDDADSIEQEICNMHGATSLREYMGRTAGFFSSHLKQYTKSRRTAPIYWNLSTPSCSYTLWLYYQRLTDQTLYTCANDFVDPRLKDVIDSANELRRKPNRSSEEEADLERLSDLELELTDFRNELLRIAKFWKPNLDDGVQITAAPLWKLFQHRQWQQKLKETWESVEKGDFDWAHLAMSIWPARVVPKCVKDRSIAIAHGLEELFWVEDGNDWRNLNEPAKEIEDHKNRRRSKVRDRVRALFKTLVIEHSDERTGDVYAHLAAGDWDDQELALLFWPERVAERCWEDAGLAAKLKVKLPDRRTKANRKKFVTGLVSKGCPDLAKQLATALECHDEPLQDLWSELAGGERDEESLALSLWPDRVVDKCTEDVELAQTHSLERFFWVQHPTETWRRRISPEAEVANEIERRKGQS